MQQTAAPSWVSKDPLKVSQLSRAASSQSSLTQEKIKVFFQLAYVRILSFLHPKPILTQSRGQQLWAVGGRRGSEALGGLGGPAHSWACTCRAALFHMVALWWTPRRYNAGIVGLMPSGPGLS